MASQFRWAIFASIVFAAVLGVYAVWTGGFDAGAAKLALSFVVLLGASLGLATLARRGEADRDGP